MSGIHHYEAFCIHSYSYMLACTLHAQYLASRNSLCTVNKSTILVTRKVLIKTICCHCSKVPTDVQFSQALRPVPHSDGAVA